MTKCQHAKDGLCDVSTHLAQHPVPLAEDACAACRTDKTPMAINRITISKAIYIGGNKPHLQEALQRIYNTGPGTELKKLIEWFAWMVKPTGSLDCTTCRTREQLMNQWGPGVCLDRIEQIVGWLKESAETYNTPFSAFASRQLIKQAIRNSR